MSVDHSPLSPLRGNQARASDPARDIWLSASAGTGKTHVLAARVYRLLLSGGVAPESILCLTFTKAGAAEMAQRINGKLAEWVRLPDCTLAEDLKALGEPFGPDARAAARKLFARVLDARGGGLRIQTIHGFCQSLLAAFPVESGLLAGFKAMDARDETALGARVLGDMIIAANAQGRLGITDDLRALVLRLSEDKTRAFLMRCARAPEAMAALGPGVEAKVRTALNLPLGDIEPLIVQRCADGAFPLSELMAVRAMNEAWGTARGTERVQGIEEWLAKPAATRVAELADLVASWTKKDGELASFAKGQAPQNSDYPALCETLFSYFNGLIELRKVSGLAAAMASSLRIGQEYARAYAHAKQAAGLVDFDDLIRKTVELLAEPDIGRWIRFKLDQATDHILVDEAQDTNANQWAIIEALADEFFSGEGAKGERPRTIFTVGDYKQAIFGFQGTDPQEFKNAQTRFARRAQGVGRKLLSLSLTESFRSTPPVLAVVDQVIDEIGHEAFGLGERDAAHISNRGGAGSVTVWAAVGDVPNEADQADEDDWISESQRVFATGLATRIRQWIDDGFVLQTTQKPVEAKDILILVRSRADLARVIVARLHAAGVPVAGLDRLRLNAPLAVRDLIACIRFVLQPADDLNLAALLVSPLIGWTQDELYVRGAQRVGNLWNHIRASDQHELLIMLKMADQITPYRFLETILSGEIDGRRKLSARLGREVFDPIEELLNAALRFEQDTTSSLQQFLNWFDHGDIDVQRDPSAPEAAVRVMTVHAAKGLEAPIVILADATRDPAVNRRDTIDWLLDDGAILPIFKPRREEMVGILTNAAIRNKTRDQQEHWRLLYVAMTRAQEKLYIGGALSSRQVNAGALSRECWHAAVTRAMITIGADRHVDGTLTYATTPVSNAALKPSSLPAAAPHVPLPDWVKQRAPAEARPPRPLTPSSLDSDNSAQPPPGPELRAAADRGRWLHSLFERLPDIAPDKRETIALRWLERSAGITDAAMRAGLVRDALAVIDDRAFAHIFAPGALAEAPLAGIIENMTIAGTVDRLIITDREVTVIDFKTGSRIPANAQTAPRAHLRQMSAYAGVLSGIFPTRMISAGLLYTGGPILHMLSPALINANKPPYPAAN